MIRYFTCAGCGARGVDKSPRQNKRFCSTNCANMVFRQEKGIGEKSANRPHCIFNEGVECDQRTCYSCGWNPTIANRRLAAICQLEV